MNDFRNVIIILCLLYILVIMIKINFGYNQNIAFVYDHSINQHNVLLGHKTFYIH